MFVWIAHVVDAQHNSMKIGPIMREIEGAGATFEPGLVHTVQHYDSALLDDFLEK